MDVGTGYRKLGPDEIVEKGDEFWNEETQQWQLQVCGAFGVLKASGSAFTYHLFRRPISTASKDPMDQFHEDALQSDTPAPVEVPSGAIMESGYRLLKRGDVVQLSDEILHRDKWRPVPPREVGWKIEKVRGVRRRKTPEGHFQDLQESASSTPFIKEEVATAVETLESVGKVPTVVLRLVDSSAPVKPFTPNKYTRYIPTLDGRKVPVDVYCVLAAFPTGSSAVDHAVKKLLAPGARGVKSRIQDLKEARDSLTRAIELEEAVEPSA